MCCHFFQDLGGEKTVGSSTAGDEDEAAQVETGGPSRL